MSYCMLAGDVTISYYMEVENVLNVLSKNLLHRKCRKSMCSVIEEVEKKLFFPALEVMGLYPEIVCLL